LGGCANIAGGNCEFQINDPELTAAINAAMGDSNPKDLGAHSGSIHHDKNFHISLHHDHDALHVDHYNVTSAFPLGAALHGIVDVGVGTLFYGTTKAFGYQ
jgi:hypothetical protein